MEVKYQKNNTTLNQRGITFIEIIIVVFIIGIIGTMVAPNFTTEKGVKAREAAQQFADRLAAVQEESLYQINFLAVYIDQVNSTHGVWKYAGSVKKSLNVQGVNERFSALNDFNFSLESQIEDDDEDQKENPEHWEVIENERFKSVNVNADVEFSVVEIQEPVRQDYENQVKYENQLILVESGIVTTPFQVEFKEDDIIYVVKLNDYSEVVVEQLNTTF